MFNEACFLISVLTILIAVYTDLKERMVYNKLTYSAGALALIIKGIESYSIYSLEPILMAVLAGALAFGSGYLLWRLGVWAGGDVKLVTAIAMLNPVNYNVIGNFLGFSGGIFATIELPVFALSMVFYSALAVMPLGVLMAFSAVFKHHEILEKARKRVVEKGAKLLGLGATASGAGIILAMFGLSDFFVLAVLVAAALLPKKIGAACAGLIGVAGLIVSPAEFILGAAMVAVPLFIVYALWIVYSQSKGIAFRETVKTSELEEGMVPNEYIVEKGGKVEVVERPSIKSVIKNFMDNRIENSLKDFKVGGKLLGGPSSAGGLTEEVAEAIRKKAAQGLAPKEISVRKTMAFVPAILIAYLALQAAGDLLWNLIL